MKIQECPFAMNILEKMRTTDDPQEKEKLKTSIRSRICGTLSDKTVCCDVENGEYRIRFDFMISQWTHT